MSSVHQLNTSCQSVQADINDKMRAILVDWLVEVHLKFKVRLLASSVHGSAHTAGPHSLGKVWQLLSCA